MLKTVSMEFSGFTYHDTVGIWKRHIEQGLLDDGYPWDYTTAAVLKGAFLETHVQAIVRAKSEGVAVFQGLAEALSLWGSQQGVSLGAHTLYKDGIAFKSGQTVFELEGPPKLLLGIERTFLNLASYVGGIATQTRKVVDRIATSPVRPLPRVACTRKILPGYRDLALYAVLVGGGAAHRMRLDAAILLKENHVSLAGGVGPAIQRARENAPHTSRIEVEVRTQEELEAALEAKADVVLLDNFSPAQVQQAVQFLKNIQQRPLVEVSGGITETNALEYVLPGVDVLSLGSLTHSVCSLDLSMVF